MFDWISALIGQLGLAGVTALMFLENLFPPIPSELVMPMAGFLAEQGRLSLIGVILSGTLGSVAGATVWYELGRALGEARFLRLIDRWGAWATLSRGDADRALDWFRRRGGLAVFLCRMVPALRTLISVPAGVAAMPRLPFLVLTTAGSLIWVCLLTLAGWLLGTRFREVEAWVNPVTTFVVVALVAVYLWRLIRALMR